MAVYTIALPKGGSSKTTTAAELVWALVDRGRRALAIDLDQQGNLTTRLGVTPATELEGTAAEVLEGAISPEDAAEPAPSLPGAHIIAGAHDLTAVEEQPPADLVTALRDMLGGLGERWDDIVIDTPPNVGAMTLAGLAAADHVVVSVQTATEAYDQISRLEEVIERRLARRIRPGLRIAAVVPALVDERRLIDRDVLALLRDRFGRRVTPPIRQAVAVRDAYTAGMTVSAYDPESPVARDYAAAMNHILSLENGAAHGQA